MSMDGLQMSSGMTMIEKGDPQILFLMKSEMNVSENWIFPDRRTPSNDLPILP